MSRPISSLTLAIRKLCDETNFDIKHEAARPILIAAGHELVAEPNWKLDDEVKAYNDKANELKESVNYEEEQHREWLDKETATALGLSDNKIKTIQKELRLRKDYDAEAARFSVMKSIYKKSLGGVVVEGSSKPTAKTTTPRTIAGAEVAKKTGRRGRPAKIRPVVSSGSNEDSLAFIKKMGGVGEAKKKMAENVASIEEMEEKITALKAENETINGHVNETIKSLKAMLSEAEAA